MCNFVEHHLMCIFVIPIQTNPQNFPIDKCSIQGTSTVALTSNSNGQTRKPSHRRGVHVNKMNRKMLRR
ncbi:hypothetical protein Y032_0049g1795 [Ancylostoma ceylanicum]|uniref:Uncharacterized protein n=1 Tax=Ancylostoma ceylanicum TaxID=53326 RepID=A0A016UB26_9BILA|nr:hypothetical protein Y032_0049g1795 [Ancylostoma ceylanicum]